MDRLTQTSGNGGVAFTFDLDIKCKPSETQKILRLAEKLKEYEDAEEKGLLVKLPCNLGTTVYYVQKCQAPSCNECLGFTRVDNCCCDFKSRIFEQKFDYRHLGAFGHSVFLTKEEAEQELAEMYGK